MSAPWEPVGFVLDGEDWEPGEVGFILKTDGRGVTIDDLRKAAAGPELLDALKLALEIEERDLRGDPVEVIERDILFSTITAAIARAEGQP